MPSFFSSVASDATNSKQQVSWSQWTCAVALGEQGTIVFSKVGERQACEGMNHKAGCIA